MRISCTFGGPYDGLWAETLGKGEYYKTFAYNIN